MPDLLTAGAVVFMKEVVIGSGVPKAFPQSETVARASYRDWA